MLVKADKPWNILKGHLASRRKNSSSCIIRVALSTPPLYRLYSTTDRGKSIVSPAGFLRVIFSRLVSKTLVVSICTNPLSLKTVWCMVVDPVTVSVRLSPVTPQEKARQKHEFKQHFRTHYSTKKSPAGNY